ncbi:MAG: hypothetical protein D6785_13410 [Planctomycetota bacterium]|nr:MAG: hypothetical protein D6785_13410 [Planctomycetota bacterium]
MSYKINHSIAPLFLIDSLVHPSLNQRIKTFLETSKGSGKDLKKAWENTVNRKFEQKLLEKQNMEPEEFYVLHLDRWKGPFHINELSKLSWFHPEMTVSPVGSSDFLPAYVIPSLLKVFKQRLHAHSGSCPACNGNLDRSIERGLPVFQCSSCKGLLVDINYLNRLLLRREQPFDEATIKRAHSIARKDKNLLSDMIQEEIKRTCPKCKKNMEKHFFSLTSPVPIDICYRCNLVWLDWKELDMIQYLLYQSRNFKQPLLKLQK